MDHKDIQKVFEAQSPDVQSDFDSIAVRISPSDVLGYVADSLYESVDSRSIRPITDQISRDDLRSCLSMLLHMRILYVRGELRRREVDVSQIEYPVIMFPILSSVGDVNRIDERLSVTILSGDGYPDRSEWSRLLVVLSRFVSIGAQVGLEVVEGFPKPKTGDLDVLRMLWVEDELKGSHICEAWKGSVSAFLVLAHQDWIWGRTRHVYTSKSFIRSRMTHISESFFRRKETR